MRDFIFIIACILGAAFILYSLVGFLVFIFTGISAI